jgi:hypothetical protein
MLFSTSKSDTTDKGTFSFFKALITVGILCLPPQCINNTSGAKLLIASLIELAKIGKTAFL